MKITWRWLVWSVALVLMLLCLTLWSSFGSLAEAGYERIVLHLAMAGLMVVLVLAWPAVGGRKAVCLLFAVAILLRLVLWAAPVSDDVNRYLWEGGLIWKGENPYAMTADDERWARHRDVYWEGMNHRDRLTAYPPGMELVMGAASWLWYDLRVFKVVALFGDLWILGILFLLFQHYGRPLRWMGWYAFNPIILVSFAAEAHLDSLMVGATLTALLMAGRKSWGWAWFWLGLAVQFKFIVIVLVPYFLVTGNWRKGWSFLLILILPSLFFGGEIWQGITGLIGFGQAGAFNGGLYETLRFVGLSDGLARTLTSGLFVGLGLLFGWRCLRGKERDLTRLSFIILAALLLCSPVVHFWYLSWIIPLVALRPSVSWILLCLTSSIYFLSWESLEAGREWGYHRGWVMVTWWPFFVVLLWESRFFFKRLREPVYAEAVSIDLIVPVYNGADRLGDFLEDLKAASPEAGEIIVVDGGSQDATTEVARSYGCRVISSERGRGAQIAVGLAASNADLQAIVHADTKPRKGWILHLRKVVRLSPECGAYTLGQRFTGNSVGLLIVEVLNEARATFGGSVFGDQTLIVRREALERVGGFPTQPLMEDVEMSWRLLERGPICYLGEEWQVSAEKWKGRFGPRFRQVIGLMLRYRLARMRGRECAAALSQKLYQEYYGS